MHNLISKKHVNLYLIVANYKGKSYYLASVADKRYLNPADLIDFNELDINLMYKIPLRITEIG